ncbi:MAG: hypothetical protein AAGL98_02200, partial [Planctomycetota bacterium]
MRKKSLAEELDKLTDRVDLQYIAVQCAYLTLDQYEKIAKRRLKAFDDGLLEQRAIKTADE